MQTMLHELHIFGPLPAAVLQEALRGFSAEPFDGEAALFDRFRPRPPHGVRNGSPVGAESGLPDGAPIRRPDTARSGPFDRAEHWPLDVAESCPPDGVQKRLPAGMESGLPDGAPIHLPDTAQSGQFDRAERWPLDVAESCPPDDVQKRLPIGVETGLPNGAPNRLPDAARSKQFDRAECWPLGVAESCPPDGVQKRLPAGVEIVLPDGAPIRRSDTARSGQFDRAERWPLGVAESCPPDGVQKRLSIGVETGLPNGAPIRRSDAARSGQFDRAERWSSDGVQSWRIHGLRGAGDRRRLLGALLVPVREARATALLRVAGSGIRGAAFDLEGTLTELEFVDALAGRLGFGERMQARTSASMTGRTPDFRRDYEERMAALRGVGVEVMEEVIGSMTLAAGVAALCDRLHAAAIPVAVISGGCSRLGEAVRKKIAARALYATVWEERAARFTGRAASPVVDPAAKLRALEDFARSTSCPLENMAATGDGANDIEMLSAAGTALLTHATARPAWPEILAALL